MAQDRIDGQARKAAPVSLHLGGLVLGKIGGGGGAARPQAGARANAVDMEFEGGGAVMDEVDVVIAMELQGGTQARGPGN